MKALQSYTYYSRYACYNKENKRRETWFEAVDRMMDMHLRKYPIIKDEIEWIRPLIKEKRLLGSQRALQYGGAPIEKKNARLHNCSFSYCDRPRFFQEALWMLLCGSGVGFSVQKHHIDKLPKIKDPATNIVETFIIPDSIEGWADALGILIATYMESKEYTEWYGKTVKFDYSQIRSLGSKLSSGVGKAPGPEPLHRSLNKIRELLNKCILEGQKKLKPINAYDIVMHSADAVLSGGVRRSATICLFSIDDQEMMSAKTGNWFYDNPQRSRSNNSVMLLRQNTSKEDFLNIIDKVREFGEPGFIWVEDLECGFNPCVEVGLYAYDSENRSGWQVCNLSEINGGKIKCEEDFALAARGAAILGTLQAGYTNFEYLGSISEEIIRREALLGVSITGMMDNPDIIFDPEIQKRMAKLVVKTNKWVANKIGINQAARTTCIKPAGSTSCVLGTSSGIHPHHARRYFRRVQANAIEPVLSFFKKYNSYAVSKSVWSANNTDEIITFCIEVPDGAKIKNQISAIELLEYVKETQKNWVCNGKVQELCANENLSHNVSNTINVRDDEWDIVADYIYKNRKWFAGISLLPSSGDLDYPQAPMVKVKLPTEILRIYGDCALVASGLVVDGMHSFDNNLWAGCDAILGLGSEQTTEDKLDWIRRVKRFAERYLGGDTRKATYLLKDVNNWKTWMDLNREYKDVPYEEFIEQENTVDLHDTIACANGACEIHI